MSPTRGRFPACLGGEDAESWDVAAEDGSRWTLTELIDFESALASWDGKVRPDREGGERAVVMRRWLATRETEGPGSRWVAGLGAAALLLAFLAATAGAGAVWGSLDRASSGVNVIWMLSATLVLLAVFVPTAFMSGITGQLYRQFALTISGAVVISTINALTLSPALCGVLLRPTSKSWMRRVAFGWFNKGFDVSTAGYRWGIQTLVRVVGLVMVVYVGLLVVTGMGFTALPSSFMPTEDQGYVFANVQLPDSASLPRTEAVMAEIDKIIEQTPGVADRVAVTGYSMIKGATVCHAGMICIL